MWRQETKHNKHTKLHTESLPAECEYGKDTKEGFTGLASALVIAPARHRNLIAMDELMAAQRQGGLEKVEDFGFIVQVDLLPLGIDRAPIESSFRRSGIVT